MKSKIALALSAGLACAAIAGDGRAQPTPQPPPDKEAVREIVREYLLEHPEVIEEAIRALQAKRQADQVARTRDALVKNRVALVDHPMSPVSGNPDGDVTLVEFFDYQCGYCKRSLEPVMDLLESDPDSGSCGRTSRCWARSRPSPRSRPWRRRSRASTWNSTRRSWERLSASPRSP